MVRPRIPGGFFLVVVLAFFGFLLVSVPPKLVEQYQVIRDAGPVAVSIYFTVIGIGAVLLGGASIWILGRLVLRSRRKAARRTRQDRSPSQLTSDEIRQELDENVDRIAQYGEDAAESAEQQKKLAELVEQLQAKRAAQSLEITAFGTVSSGKSSLLNALAGREVFQTDARGGTTLCRNEIPWPGQDRVRLVDTPGLGEVDGETHGAVAAAAARDADLVLLVVDGPLRESESQLLTRLGEMEKRVLICLNKADWYDDAQRRDLLGQLAGQVGKFVSREDIVAVRSRPAQRPQVRVGPDGGQRTEWVDVEPDIAPLAARMLAVIAHDGSELLLANLLMQSRGLVKEARRQVEQTLDRRAWAMIDRYMWAAGGAAAVSPLPLLDLAAGGAVTVKMVIDLAAVYRQEVDIEVVTNLLGQLGKNLVGILGVSAATPAVVSAVAGLLKTVPGAGTIAGGALQGVVQALITRWIGAVFVAYYRQQMQEPEGGLAGLARRQWQHVTSAAELRKLLRSASRHLAQSRVDDDDDREPDNQYSAPADGGD